MATGFIRTEVSSKHSKEVYWVIDDVDRRLKKTDILLSSVFCFGGQQWRVLLQRIELLNSRYIDVALSRVTISDQAPPFPFVRWHAGVLDRNGEWHYDRSGMVGLETAYREWMTVADFPGPEWAYISLEKDLYMPDDRLTVAIQLDCDSGCIQMDPDGTEKSTFEASLKAGEYSRYFKDMVWTIDDVKRRLEKCDKFLGDVFSGASQHWRLLLQSEAFEDNLRLKVSISRKDMSSEPPHIPAVMWCVGFLDKDNDFYHERSGWVKLETPCNEWTTVDEWLGPEWTSVCEKKDLLMPGDRLTLGVVICWFVSKPSYCEWKIPGGVSSADSNLKDSLMLGSECDVTLQVRDRTFHMHRPILEVISPVMAAMLYPSREEKEHQVVHLADCDPGAFNVFLSFAYLGSLGEHTADRIQQVYYIADTYVVPVLKEKCSERLLTTLTVNSVCSVLALAVRHRDAKLYERAGEFFASKALDVYHTDEWLEFMVTHTNIANALIIFSHEWVEHMNAESSSKTVE